MTGKRLEWKSSVRPQQSQIDQVVGKKKLILFQTERLVVTDGVVACTK